MLFTAYGTFSWWQCGENPVSELPVHFGYPTIIMLLE